MPDKGRYLDKTAIRNAATIIVLRNRTTNPAVLMGQRGAGAAFMPNKFVFPGGAVDRNDALVPTAHPLSPDCAARLSEATQLPAEALAAAAIRELWEETGLILGAPGKWQEPPPQGWRGFSRTGNLPDPSALRFVFRAVTPEGEPRRFDARFFLVEADQIISDLDDFSGAEDELAHLQWVPLDQARHYDLPFITEVVLAEIARNLGSAAQPATVPFFRNEDEAHFVARLGGQRPLDRI